MGIEGSIIRFRLEKGTGLPSQCLSTRKFTTDYPKHTGSLPQASAAWDGDRGIAL
ncbi:hypothetical protein J7297_04359 [Nakaseomyces glabratus]|nr:hypothetical protein J7296_04350 [Nakaseomyces glabratus]KAH7582739.1 hypothetical protein J7297_04359 [Nakaseomyces glabratus]